MTQNDANATLTNKISPVCVISPVRMWPPSAKRWMSLGTLDKGLQVKKKLAAYTTSHRIHLEGRN